MCVIIYQPKGSRLEKDRAERLWAANSHGGGFTFINDDHELVVTKSLGFKSYWSQFEQARSQFPDRDFLLHMRIKTHGPVNLDNTHPFYVTDEMVMMHNGIITQVPDDALKSDSRVFIDVVLGDLPLNWLDNPWIEDMLADFIGWSKLAFMTTNLDMEKEVYIVNEASGRWTDDMWFSSQAGVAKPGPKAAGPGHKKAQKTGAIWTQEDGKWSKKEATGGTTPNLGGREKRSTYLVPSTSEASASDDKDFDEWLGANGHELHESLPLSMLIDEEEMNGLWHKFLVDLRKEMGNKHHIMWIISQGKWECLGCDEKVDGSTGDCQCWNKLCLDCTRFAVECICHSGFVKEPTWCDECPEGTVESAIQAYMDTEDTVVQIRQSERTDEQTDTKVGQTDLGPTTPTRKAD